MRKDVSTVAVPLTTGTAKLKLAVVVLAVMEEMMVRGEKTFRSMVAKFMALQEDGAMKFWFMAEKVNSRAEAVRKGKAEGILSCWARK